MERLRPGLSEDEIRTRLGEVQLQPTQESLDWWMWHDGPHGGAWLEVITGSGLHALRLEWAVHDCHMQRQISD